MSTISGRGAVIRSWVDVDVLIGNVIEYGPQRNLSGFCIMPIRLTQVPPTCSGTALPSRFPFFGRVVSAGEFGWIHVPKPPLATL